MAERRAELIFQQHLTLLRERCKAANVLLSDHLRDHLSRVRGEKVRALALADALEPKEAEKRLVEEYRVRFFANLIEALLLAVPNAQSRQAAIDKEIRLALSERGRDAAHRSHEKTRRIKDELLQAYRREIAPDVSAQKAADCLQGRGSWKDLSHRTIAEYIRAERKLPAAGRT